MLRSVVMRVMRAWFGHVGLANRTLIQRRFGRSVLAVGQKE